MAHAHYFTNPADLDGLRRYFKTQDADLQLLSFEAQPLSGSNDAHVKTVNAFTAALLHCCKVSRLFQRRAKASSLTQTVISALLHSAGLAIASGSVPGNYLRDSEACDLQ